jgi:hypothetical protein
MRRGSVSAVRVDEPGRKRGASDPGGVLLGQALVHQSFLAERQVYMPAAALIWRGQGSGRTSPSQPL